MALQVSPLSATCLAAVSNEREKEAEYSSSDRGRGQPAEYLIKTLGEKCTTDLEEGETQNQRVNTGHLNLRTHESADAVVGEIARMDSLGKCENCAKCENGSKMPLLHEANNPNCEERPGRFEMLI